MGDPKTCKHMEFSADVRIARMEDTGQFVAEMTIRCAECSLPFQFLGMEPGLDMGGARVSLDGLEARLSIAPQGQKPNPMQRLAYGVRHHG